MISMPKRLIAAVLLAAFCAPAMAAEKTEYLKSLEKTWLNEIKPGKGPVRRRKPKVRRPEQDAFGGVNGNRYERTGFCTSKQKLSWWQVDLQKSYTISMILVANREKNEERAAKLEILL